MTDELYRMERAILDSHNRVVSKEYASELVYAYRRRVRELESEIHELRELRLREGARGVKSGVGI